MMCLERCHLEQVPRDEQRLHIKKNRLCQKHLEQGTTQNLSLKMLKNTHSKNI